MDDPDEHALVVKALTDGLGGCVEWDARSANRVMGDQSLRGLTPRFLKTELIDRVRKSGGQVVKQVRETRDTYKKDYRFY